MIKSNKIEWGNGHKKYMKEFSKAKLYAYQKTFYFPDVKLNGKKVDRKF